MLLHVITRIYQVSPVSPLVWSISIGQNCGPYKRALLSYYRPICTYCVGSDGSIKSQSASAVAKKRFLQIRSDALLRLFVSRQVDPASLPPRLSSHHRTHISKSDLGLGRRHTTRRIPTISYVAVPKISDTRSSLCCQRVHGNDEANKAIEAR